MENQQQPIQQPEKSKKKIYKGWLFWTIVAIIVIVCLYMLIVIYNRYFSQSSMEEDYWHDTDIACISDSDCLVSGCDCISPNKDNNAEYYREEGWCIPVIKCRCNKTLGICQKK